MGGSGKTTNKGKCKAHLRKAKENQFVYKCEWLTCTESCDSINQLNHHVDRHRQGYTNSCTATSTEDERFVFHCQWRDCGSPIEGSLDDFSRHLFYHTFHQYLKYLGGHIQEVEKLCRCLLGTETRNVIPELPEKLICRWHDCNMAYDNPYVFYGHVSYHCEDFPKGNNLNQPIRCQWEGCTTITKSCHKLREHMRSHTQAKVVACPTCGALFSNNTRFIDHLKRQASGKELSYECPHCHRLFASERILRDHMRHHVSHYKCPICDMTCYAPSGLQEHIRYRHSQERNFACSKCDQTFKREVDLRRHLISPAHDSPQREWRCSQAGCEQTFSSRQKLLMHYSSSHETANKDYQCHVCEKTFTRGHYLTQHLITVHNYRWPSGHNRFRYKIHSDGFRRLQIIRYESIEVSQQVLGHELPTAPCDTNEVGGTSVVVTVDKSLSHIPGPVTNDSSNNLPQHPKSATLPMDLVCDPQDSSLQANGESPSLGRTSAVSGDKDNVDSIVTSMRGEQGELEKGDSLAKAWQSSSVVSPQNGNLSPHNVGSEPHAYDNPDSGLVQGNCSHDRPQPDNLTADECAKAVRGVKRKKPAGKDSPQKDPRRKRKRRKATMSSDVTQNHQQMTSRKSTNLKRKSTEQANRRGQKVAFELLTTAVKRPLYSNTTDGDSSNSSTLYTMLSPGQEDSLSQAARAIDLTLQDSCLSPKDSPRKTCIKRQKGPATFKFPDDVDATSPLSQPLVDFGHSDSESLSSEELTSINSTADVESPTLYTLQSPVQRRDGLHTHYSLRSIPGQAVKSPTCPTIKTLDSEDEDESPELDSSLNDTPQSPTRYALISPNPGEPSSPTLYTLTSPKHESGQSPTHYALKSPLEESAQSPTRYTLNDPDEEERAQSLSLYALARTKEEPSMAEYQSSLPTLTSPDDGNLQSPADSQALSSPKYMLNSSLDDNSQSPTRYTLGSVHSVFDENAQSPSRYKLQHCLNESVQSSTLYALKTPSNESEGPPELHSSFKIIKSEPSSGSALEELQAFNLQVQAHTPSLSLQYEVKPHFIVKQENLLESNAKAPSPKFLSHLESSPLQTIDEDSSLSSAQNKLSAFNAHAHVQTLFKAEHLQPNSQCIVVKQENPSESNWKASSPNSLTHLDSAAPFQTSDWGLSANMVEDRLWAFNLQAQAKTLLDLQAKPHSVVVKQENPSESNIKISSPRFLSHRDSSALLTIEDDICPSPKVKETVSAQSQTPLESQYLQPNAQYIVVKQENPPEPIWKASSPTFLTHLDSSAFQTSDWELSPNPTLEDNSRVSNQRVQAKTQLDLHAKSHCIAVVKQENPSESDWKASSPKFLLRSNSSSFQTEQKCPLETVSQGEFEKTPSPFLPSFEVMHGPRTSSPLPKSDPDCVQRENIEPFISFDSDELSQTTKARNMWSPSRDEFIHLQVPPTPGKNLILDEFTSSSHKEVSLSSEASSLTASKTYIARPSTSGHDTSVSANNNNVCGPSEISKCARQRVYSSGKKSKRRAATCGVGERGEDSCCDKSVGERREDSCCDKSVGERREDSCCDKLASLPHRQGGERDVEEHLAKSHDDKDETETYNLEMLGEVALLTQSHASGE